MEETKKRVDVFGFLWKILRLVFAILMGAILLVFGTPMLILIYAINVIKVGIFFFISFLLMWGLLDTIGLGHVALAINDFFEPQYRMNIFIALFLIFVAYFTYLQAKGEIE